MISRKEANAAAEQVLAFERRRLVELQNARAPRVPAFLRVRGLSSLEPRDRAALLRRAQSNVLAKGWFVFWAAAWFAGVAISWYLTQDGQSSLGPLWVGVAGVGVVVLRYGFVRRELSRLVSESTSG